MVDCPAVGKGSGYPLYNPLPTEQGPFPFCQRTTSGECAGDVIEKMAEMDQGPALVRGGYCRKIGAEPFITINPCWGIRQRKTRHGRIRQWLEPQVRISLDEWNGMPGTVLPV